MFTAPRATAAALALVCATTCVAAWAGPRVSGLYVGEVGAGNKVLMSLKPGAGAQALAGEYHYARIWSQDSLELAGKVDSARHIRMRETLVGQDGERSRSGEFRGEVSPDGTAITGTWKSGDGRRNHAFALVRAAEWVRQSVKADRGVRTCVRPRFFDPGYARVNMELAEACDYFLADGQDGPGTMSLEIDSVTGSVVAAVAYARTGRERPPEVITVDLAADEDGTNPLQAALAARR